MEPSRLARRRPPLPSACSTRRAPAERALPSRWIWLSLALCGIPVLCASLGTRGEREPLAAPERLAHEPPAARRALLAPQALTARRAVLPSPAADAAAAPDAPEPPPGAPRAARASDEPAPASLLVRVLDEERWPARDALLELRHTLVSGAEHLERIALDASGCYRATLAPGELCLAAWSPAATAGPLQAELRAGARTELELVLVPARAVAGIVLDAWSGAPIAGARVSFWTFAETDRVLSAADGTFRHPRFPGVDFAHQVRVEAEGYGASVRYLEFPSPESWTLPAACDGEPGESGAGTPWLRLALVPALAIRGRAVDPSGAALAGARVRAEGYFRILPAVASRDDALTATDEQGRFALEGLRSDVGHALRVDLAGYAEHTLELPADGTREISVGTLVLSPELALAGVVLDPQGEPVADITVELAPEEPSAARASGTLDVAARVDGQKSTRTDAQGLFVFEGLASARYRLWVTRDRGALAETSVHAADLEAELVLRLPAHTLTLEGLVQDEHGLVANAAIELERFGPVGRVRSDAAGRFRIAGLDDEAAYRLLASAPGEPGGPPWTGRAEVWGHGPVRVRLERSSR